MRIHLVSPMPAVQDMNTVAHHPEVLSRCHRLTTCTDCAEPAAAMQNIAWLYWLPWLQCWSPMRECLHSLSCRGHWLHKHNNHPASKSYCIAACHARSMSVSTSGRLSRSSHSHAPRCTRTRLTWRSNLWRCRRSMSGDATGLFKLSLRQIALVLYTATLSLNYATGYRGTASSQLSKSLFQGSDAAGELLALAGSAGLPCVSLGKGARS